MKPKTIDEYIAMQPASHHQMLEQIRQVIRSVVPMAEETISYLIAAYKYNGLLVGFGSNKKGCSFYVMSGTILESYADELKNYSGTKGAIHFDLDKKLPVSLIKKITKQRLKENIQKAKLKQRK